MKARKHFVRTLFCKNILIILYLIAIKDDGYDSSLDSSKQ